MEVHNMTLRVQAVEDLPSPIAKSCNAAPTLLLRWHCIHPTISWLTILMLYYTRQGIISTGSELPRLDFTSLDLTHTSLHLTRLHLSEVLPIDKTSLHLTCQDLLDFIWLGLAMLRFHLAWLGLSCAEEGRGEERKGEDERRRRRGVWDAGENQEPHI